jgi:hypothetical protein
LAFQLGPRKLQEFLEEVVLLVEVEEEVALLDLLVEVEEELLLELEQ